MGILETIVAPIIGGVMEKFFTNFDSSKLDIGMGSVELTEMLVNPAVFDNVGVPLKLVFGKVGRIYIEFGISTNITGALFGGGSAVEVKDVVVELKDAYILLAPASSVRYSENKEDEKKKKQKALEDALAQDPDLNVVPPPGDANAAMIMGIINNIKVIVENIHIRYEDETTNSGSPFSFGLTLNRLQAVSTDGKWKPMPTDTKAETFYKLVSLEDFGIYWNTKSELLRPTVLSPAAQAASISKMQQLIGGDNHELRYVIGQLNGDAKAIVTMKPHKLETKFSKPLADVVLSMEKVDIDLTNEQFHDVLLLMESLEDRARQQPYLAFRPFGLPHQGYPKQWWKYAYTCARVGVKQRNRLYDADYLVQQRRLCSQYELAYADYRQKLTLKTATDAEKKKYMDLEDQIGNQDILIIRKRVALKDKSVVANQETVSGWTSYYKVALEPTKLKKVLEESLTSDEMRELQQYIDFAPEDADARNFPAGYTQMKFGFELPKFTATVRQVQVTGREIDVFQFWTKDISTRAEMYPAEKGMWAEVVLGHMGVTGVSSGGQIPSFAKSLTSGDERFVVLSYAKNPREKSPGKYIDIKCERTEVIYDSPTIQKLIDCFTWPSGVELQKTTAAVGDAMENAKNMSVSGLKEMIENTEEMFVDITCKAPYILLPSRGNMQTADTILVINAGQLTLKTIPRERSITDGRSIQDVGMGSALGDVSMEIQKLTYNQYVATYTDVECYVALRGEDIMAAINHTFPPSDPGVYYTDRPAQIFKAEETIISVNQCIIKDDTRFPKLKIGVSVPLLDFQLTDNRALKLVRLLATIPLPLMKPAPSAFLEGVEDPNFHYETEADKLVKEQVLTNEPKPGEDLGADVLTQDPETAPQFTALMLEIHIKLVKLMLLRLNEKEKSATPLLDLNLWNAEVTGRFRTYGMSADISFGRATAAYLDAKVLGQTPGTPVFLLYTPERMDRPLLKFHLFSISDACPRAKSGGQVRQKATIKTQCVDIILHQESLEGLLLLVDRILDEFANSELLKPKPKQNAAPKKKDDTVAKMKALGLKKKQNEDDILLKATALLNDFKVSLVSEKRNIATFWVGSIIAEYEDKLLKSRIFAQVSDVEMTNLDTPSLYTRVMKSDPEVPLVVGTVYLHKETFSAQDPDIEVLFKLTCPPVILIGEYAGNIVDFFAHLQLARDAFNDAATATTAVAISAVRDAYKTEKKILLDVKLDSPQLIFVKSSLSPEALVLDLGNLIVKNKLEGVPTSTSRTAVLDGMDVMLEGLCVSRVIMDSETQNIKASVHLLQPVVLKLNIRRSLSPWYKKLPAIDVSGELETTDVKLSNLDVEVAATCILNYLHRVQKSLKAVMSKPTPEPSAEGTTSAGGSSKPMLGGEGVGLPQEVEAYKLGAKFTIVQIGLHFYQQVTLLDGMSGIVQRDPVGCLAEFYLQTMDLGYKVWENKDMAVNLSLDEILLRDSRPTAGDIKDFIVKKEDANMPNAPFLQFTLSTQNIPRQSTTYIVNATAQGLSLILSLEFMKLLLDFGLSATKSIPKGDDEQKVEDGSAVKLDKKTPKLFGAEGEEAEKGLETKDEGISLPLIKGKVDLRRAEILILENIRSNETNALIGYGNSSFWMDSENGKGSWGEGSWSFGLITAKYNPGKANEDVCDVLKPVEMKVKAQLSPQAGTDVLIEFTEVYLQVNAGTLLLLAKIGNSLQAVVSAAQRNEAASEIGRKDYVDVWGPRGNAEQEYWFLDAAALTTTLNRHKGIGPADPLTILVTQAKNLPEKLQVRLPRVVMILEAGVSTKPTPMILLDGYAFINVQDWSGNLGISTAVGGCIYYNNITKGTWEYLVEPNEDARGEWTPWEFQCNIVKKPPVGGKTAFSATVTSDDLVEITVSKSSIDLLKALGENFGNSIRFGISEADVNTPPYVFHNDVGSDVWIRLSVGQTGLTYTQGTRVEASGVLVRQGEILELGMELQDIKTSAADQKERMFNILIPEFMNFRETISVRYNGTRYFQLKDKQGNSFAMLVEIKAQKNFSTLIVARSVVQITSELSLPVDVTGVVGRTEVAIGRLEPYKAMNFPLVVLRSGVANIGLEFTAAGYNKTNKSQAFAALAKLTDKTRDFVVAKSLTPGDSDGKIRIIGSAESASIDGSTGPSKGRIYRLLLKPPLVVNNFLPIPLLVSTDGRFFISIDPGTPMDILTANTEVSSSYLVLMLQGFQGTTWTASVRLKVKTQTDSLLFRASDTITVGEINSIEFKSETGRRLYFRFLPTVYEGKLEELSVFSPYWMVNRTELSLCYQGASSSGTTSRINHDATDQGPIMMAFDVDGLEKARFFIADSDWSPPLNLDTPMTVDIDCKGKEMDYEVIVSVELSASNLTKTVSFLPKYRITNTCSFDVLVSQNGKFGTELTAPAKTTIPFWPKRRVGEPLDLLLRINGTEDYTSTFRFDGVHISLLKLNNKYGGLGVNVNVLATKGTLTISEFDLAEVPVLIVNDTNDLDIDFQQAGVGIGRLIPARQSLVYSWDDLSKGQQIEWKIPSLAGAVGFPKQFEMNTATSGEFTAPDKEDEEKTKIYSWAAFVSGLRTIFVLTESNGLLPLVEEYLEMGKSNTTEADVKSPLTLEANLQLEGIGLSLIDDQACKDILYLRLLSTPPLWEGTSLGGTRYKTLPQNQILALEKGYVNYVTGKCTDRPVKLEGGIMIDYANYRMSAPKSQQLKRHAYKPGLSVRVRLYEYSKELTLSVAQLQIDNQLQDTEFPNLLRIAPIPKSVRTQSEIPLPLLLVNYKDWAQGTGTATVQAKIILQEFMVAVDTTLIKNASAIFIPESAGKVSPQTKGHYDYDYKRASLADLEYYRLEGEKISSESAVAIYDLLRAYKLKVRVTATMCKDPDGGYFQNLLLGLGSGVISVSDVPIEIDGLEIFQKRWTQEQLMDAVIQHYKSGALSNVYKFILGIDLLGNPSKLIGGFGSGLSKLVTEPFQGAMEGDLIEGISNGAVGALQGTVGGVTDALGTLTKQVGKLTSGLGVPGLENVFNFLSGSLLSVGAAVGDKKEQNISLRPRRILNPNQALRPYSLFNTIGETVYQKVWNDYSSPGDHIIHFTNADPQGNLEILLLTQYIVYCAVASPKLEIVNRKWSYQWSELDKVEKAPNNGIKFKEPARGLGAFSLGLGILPVNENIAHMTTAETATEAFRACTQAWRNAKRK